MKSNLTFEITAFSVKVFTIILLLSPLLGNAREENGEKSLSSKEIIQEEKFVEINGIEQ